MTATQKPMNTPSPYRTFISHGFLRVSRYNPESREYTHIASISAACEDADKRASEVIAKDKAERVNMAIPTTRLASDLARIAGEHRPMDNEALATKFEKFLSSTLS